jgi:hypothetical protein
LNHPVLHCKKKDIYITDSHNKFLPISVDPSEHGGDADICDKLAEVLDDGSEA